MKLLKMRYITVFLAVLFFATNVFADGESSKSNDKIHWMTWDEVQVAMKKQPKKVWVDVYTEWCVWCKRMDKGTFTNPNVVKYMNENFYAVKFDAETREDIRFMGNVFKFVPPPEGGRNGTNALAIALLRGNLGYPAMVYMEENFQGPVAIPGYQQVPQLEMLFSYLREGVYKKQIPLDEYAKTFKPTWK